ncbi:unnamed protein product [Moneuplotes crassus]|uniref:Uncharacterized protein n=1 Tax=Euplotes crassus TaxID=5936 RepID=A0AAD1Y188_EUPCR|nr:unnamed protein product [Moneuplotes crassus]
MKTISKKNRATKKKSRGKKSKKKETGAFDGLADALGGSLKGVEKSMKTMENEKNRLKNSVVSKMKRRRIEKRDKMSKKLEEDQQKVQVIMNNDAFNENPLDILLNHVTNVVSTKKKEE